jgi:hypothetical protein
MKITFILYSILEKLLSVSRIAIGFKNKEAVYVPDCGLHSTLGGRAFCGSAPDHAAYDCGANAITKAGQDRGAKAGQDRGAKAGQDRSAKAGQDTKRFRVSQRR